MTDYPIRYLETVSSGAPSCADTFISDISTLHRNDTDYALIGESVSQMDADAYFEDAPKQDVYKGPSALYHDISCYLDLRFLAAIEGGKNLDLADNETYKWISDYYNRVCTPSDLGRLYNYLQLLKDDCKGNSLFPEGLLVADDKKILSWLASGLKNISMDRLLTVIRNYGKLPLKMRQQVALDILEALKEKARERGFQRIEGLSPIIADIVREEMKFDIGKYISVFKSIYNNQLDIKNIFGNITSKGTGFVVENIFDYKPTSFLGKVIEAWGYIGYLEPGDSKPLLSLLVNEDLEADERAMIARAMGDMAYIDTEEKNIVAQKLYRFVEEALEGSLSVKTVRSKWFDGKMGRVLFEAIISLGKLGVNAKVLASALFYPMFEKDANTGWVNLAGLKGLSLLYDVAKEPAKSEIHEIISKGGVRHPLAVCREFAIEVLGLQKGL